MPQVDSLSQLPLPVLSVYLHTCPVDASLHGAVAAHLAWLKRESRSFAHELPPSEQKCFEEQLGRVVEFLQQRTPHEKSLAIFAGSHAWEVVPLQLQVKNELHWGKPAVWPLLCLASEHKACCVVVVDQAGARFFRYWQGELAESEEKRFTIDVSSWKKKELGKFMREGIKKTRGSQRDTFEHRMDAQYAHLCQETSRQASKFCVKEGFKAVFLVGSDRLIKPIKAGFPPEFPLPVVLFEQDLARVNVLELQKHLEPQISEWQAKQELEQVSALLGSERGAVAGFDETLAALQDGRIRTLMLARELDASLRQCLSCGRADRSADPVCLSCGGKRQGVTLREVLLDLARPGKTAVETVSGAAAAKLNEAGGMAAWLREPKTVKARAAR